MKLTKQLHASEVLFTSYLCASQYINILPKFNFWSFERHCISKESSDSKERHHDWHHTIKTNSQHKAEDILQRKCREGCLPCSPVHRATEQTAGWHTEALPLARSTGEDDRCPPQWNRCSTAPADQQDDICTALYSFLIIIDESLSRVTATGSMNVCTLSVFAGYQYRR